MTGVQHRFITALLVPPIAYGTYYLTGSTILATAAGLGTLTNMLVNPDLDLADRPKNVMHFPFFFYGKVISKLGGHRSFWSHFPVVGSIGRVLYVAFLLWPVWLGLGRPTISVNWPFLGWMFVGLATADAMHFACDGFGVKKHKEKEVSKPRKKFSPWLYNQ